MQAPDLFSLLSSVHRPAFFDPAPARRALHFLHASPII